MSVRKRIFWLLALIVAVAIIQTPMPARADTVPGYPTPVCQSQGWTAYSTPWVAGLGAIEIRFHLWINGSLGPTSVRGRWEAAGRTWSGDVWRSAHTGGDHFWINRDGFGSAFLVPGPPPEGGGWLRYGLSVVDGFGCFVVDNIIVTRYSNTDGPPIPTTTPAATGVQPSQSASPSASPTSGWCSVYNGSQWEWVPCTTAQPTAAPTGTPGPSPTPGADPSCPDPYTGAGTFVFHETWDADMCLVWTDTTVQANSTVSAVWTGSAYQAETPTTNGGPGLRIATTGGGASWIESIGCAATVVGAFGFHTPVGGTWAAVTCNGGAFSLGGIASGVPVYITSGATQNGDGPNGLDGTLVVTVTGLASPTPSISPSPSPSPDPSFVTFCEENPGSWICASAPPSFGTPPPSPPDDGGWGPVDICPPGQDILACSTWPPSPAPAVPDVAGDAISQLIDDAREHSPFGELGQVADALTGGLEGAAGAAVDYCFTLPWWTPIGTQNVESCLPMEDVAGWAAPVRGILLAAFVLAFSAVVLRRVTENV